MTNLDQLVRRIQNCEKIRKELAFSHAWMSKESVDGQWVHDLDLDEIKKERVGSFCARFGRMQDYFSDKVIPVWVAAVGERTGSALENFSVAERAGILTIRSESVPELRKLRNDLTQLYR